MSETSFTILNYSQSLNISTDEISASHDSLNIYLNIPVNFTFRTKNDEYAFDIYTVIAKLSFLNPQQRLSEIIMPVSSTVYAREVKRGFQLRFILDEKTLHFIEKNRVNGLFFLLELTIHLSIKSSTLEVGKRYYNPEYLQIETTSINFQISKSDWVEKILPQTGFRNLKLIEIPLSHNRLNEAYHDIIFEFNKAEQYFNSHDYNKCVAHCRGALDGLTRNLKKIKEGLSSESGFEWLQTIDKETRDWIDKLNQKSSAITSKAHHAGQKTDFTRPEAESIYIIVLGLLHYVGNVVY